MNFFRQRKCHNYKYENYKRKNLIGKSKYTVKIVDQPLVKLVGMLKNKSIKIIYFHNK